MGEFGPFATTVAVAAALIATFSALLLKAIGRIKKWTWLVDGSPPFLVTAGARALCVVLIGATFLIIDESNYFGFVGAGIGSGILAFLAVVVFDLWRKRYIISIPITGPDGEQLGANIGKPQFEQLVVGLEEDMKFDAKSAYQEQHDECGGALSIAEFMKGFGTSKLNDPSAIWTRELLAKISNQLTVALMCIVLFAVMALFWAAIAIDVSGRSADLIDPEKVEQSHLQKFDVNTESGV